MRAERIWSHRLRTVAKPQGGKKMKKIFLVSLIAVFFCSSTGALNAMEGILAPSPGATVSMDLKDASLKDVLKILSIQSGMNFIASEAVADRTLTLYLDKVSLKDSMDKIFTANNLTYDLDKQANIFIVKDWGKPQIETVTKVFYLKHATVSSSSLKEEMKNNISSSSTTTTTTSTSATSGKWMTDDDAGITKAVRKLLTAYGSLIEDFRTNSLVVTDVPSRMPVIEQVVKALDIAVSEVMLEVEILDVSKNAVDEIGFKFGQTPFSVALTGGTVEVGFPFKSWTKMFSANPVAGALGDLAINTGTGYTMALDFLRTQTDTKYLARPRILTLNNETAEIKITTQETIGVTTSVSGTPSVVTTTPERAETGVMLRVTPQIDSETGEITMFVMPTVKDSVTSTIPIGGTSLVTGAPKYKDPEERATKSTVRVKDGETVIMGGLLRNQRTDVITKLPFLGDIPLLGTLFRHRETSPDRERELLVFITPHIVKDSNTMLVQAKNTVAEREQSIASGVDRQAAITSNLDKYDKKQK